MKQKFTIKDFFKRYPDDDTCLNEIFRMRFGSLAACTICGVAGAKYYRVKDRKCYECGDCGKQIYPTAGTVMEGSTTPLSLWFYAIYLFSTSKNGISSKELERQLGVTYKCAWRMGHKIRELMGKDDGQMFKGIVEVDEMLMGGKVRGGKRGWGAENKCCVVGVVERGGRIKTTHISDRDRANILPCIEEKVEKGTVVNTDEFRAYNILTEKGYEHKTVTHSKYQWANGDAHTNTMEGHWSNLQKSIFGTHTFVARKHLQKYLAEFDFRYSYRHGQIFDEIIKRIA